VGGGGGGREREREGRGVARIFPPLSNLSSHFLVEQAERSKSHRGTDRRLDPPSRLFKGGDEGIYTRMYVSV